MAELRAVVLKTCPCQPVNEKIWRGGDFIIIKVSQLPTCRSVLSGQDSKTKNNSIMLCYAIMSICVCVKRILPAGLYKKEGKT